MFVEDGEEARPVGVGVVGAAVDDKASLFVAKLAEVSADLEGGRAHAFCFVDVQFMNAIVSIKGRG